MSKKINKPVDVVKKSISIPPGNNQSLHPNTSSLYYKFSANTGLHIFFIILFPVFIYLNVVNYSFIADDDVIIKNNLTTLSNLHNIGKAFMTDAFCRAPGISVYSLYRPFQTLSFMVDASISGSNPWMYHLTNLMLHMLTCIALYFLLQFFNFKKVTSFFGSMLFSVHPLLAGNVSWISARGDLLIGLTGILLFLTMGYYFKTNKIVLFILHFFTFVIAIFSKETVLLFPLLLLLFYLIFLRDKQKDKRIIKFIVIWILISSLYLFIKRFYFLENHPNSIFGIPALIQNLDFLPAVLSRALIPVSLPLFAPFDLFSIISGLCIILILIYVSYRLYKQKHWLPLFGIFWFLIFIFPPMLFRQDNYDFMIINLEQRIYLPLIGLVITVCSLLKNFIEKNLNTVKLSICVIVIFIFSGLAYKHSNTFQNVLTYTQAVVDKNPLNSEAFRYRALGFVDMRNFSAAKENFDIAIDISQDLEVYLSRAKVKTELDDYIGAEKDITFVLNNNFMPDYCYYFRSITRMHLGKYDEALSDLEKAEKLNPSDSRIFNLKGEIFFELHEYSRAISEFSKSILLAPKLLEPYRGRMKARLCLGDLNGVLNDCVNIFSLKPDDLNTFENMGQAYRDLKKYELSLMIYSDAIKLDSSFAPAYFGRGLTKELMNNINGAVLDWKKALQLGYEPARKELEKYLH